MTGLHVKSFFLIGVASALVLAGCDEGTIPSFPPKGADAGVNDGAPEASVVRTVETRNPFGDTANPTNLMADGDFELTGRTGQMPWFTFTQSGQGTLDYATGGRCKSGVRCGSIAAGTVLIGYFASPKTGGMTASIWIHPGSGNCGDVQIVAIDLDDQASAVSATLKSTLQDSGGWCNFTGSIPNMANKQPVLYVTVNDGVAGVALIDDGVILPAVGTQDVTKSNVKMSTVMRERVRFIAEWIRAHRRF